jgi:hypothetical protein
MTFMTSGLRILAAITLISGLIEPAVAQEQHHGYTPPAAGTTHAVVAEHGMVVSQEKLSMREAKGLRVIGQGDIWHGDTDFRRAHC